MMWNSVLVVLVTCLLEVKGKLVSCQQMEPCVRGDRGDCVSQAQICDGQGDCPAGEDEDPFYCKSWECKHGVRCREDDICINVPHQTMCSGGAAVCPDQSDQSFCLAKLFTGCFLQSWQGLKIADCRADCFCELLDKSDTRRRSVRVFKSSGQSYRSTTVLGRVCVDRTSPLVCDGTADCMFGEDEAEELCKGKQEARVGQEVEVELVERRERTLAEEAEEFDILGMADRGEEEPTQLVNILDLHLMVPTFLATLLGVLVISVVIVLVMLRLSSRNKKPETPIPPHGSELQFQEKECPNAPAPRWSLRTTSIVKELGRGFYSRVYLAQSRKEPAAFIAIKTVDGQTGNRGEECILNEISVLSRLAPHVNVVRLIGSNSDERLVVVEYCVHGNLLDYISRHKDHYLNELNQSTGELDRAHPPLVNSPVLSESNPLPDYLTTLQTRMEEEGGQMDDKEKTNSSRGYLEMTSSSRSNLNTSRLLFWASQLSRGLKYLTDQGIIHRDIALRNILLTSNDIIRIADFGLAVSLFSPGSSPSKYQGGGYNPQYWSRSNRPQPFKWMAVESLLENVYSQSSDVWAFGITMWEMFSLGKEPYGQINPIELTKLLQTGRRLEQCLFAPQKVNLLMQNCWSEDPQQRPPFEEIVKMLSQYVPQDNPDPQPNRHRLDSGVEDCDSGYLELTTSGTTPSSSYPRSSSPSQGSLSSTLHPSLGSLSSSLRPPSKISSPHLSRPPSQQQPVQYWANYKIVNSGGLKVPRE